MAAAAKPHENLKKCILLHNCKEGIHSRPWINGTHQDVVDYNGRTPSEVTETLDARKQVA